MQPFNIRELRNTDTAALLAFEVRNRAWFESHIDPRDPAFYSLNGVTEHIEDYLYGLACGAWHPLVIEDGNRHIVGRANLKSIDSTLNVAEVGYRIDQQSCGQGLATLALKRLIQEARARWALKQLVACVYKENVGSRIVLERCGFLPEPAAGGASTGAECRFILSI